MLFYHYTCRRNIEGIFSDGILRKGSVAINELLVDKFKAVNLTTDSSPEGHGLPDGREISNEEAVIFGGYSENEGKKFCADHTKYRIEIELPVSQYLVAAKQFHQSQPLVLTALELKGYFPTKQDLTDAELLLSQVGIANGSIIGKSDTWWYYFNEIPVRAFTCVSVRDPLGQFWPVTPSNFAGLLKKLAV